MDPSAGDTPVQTRRRILVATWLTLVAAAAVAFGLRTVFINDLIVTDDAVHFQAGDAWVHVRLIEHLVHNFPHRTVFDPYLAFPGGGAVPVAPLLDWLAAVIALVVGGGSPSPRTIELVCAYLPAVLGALAVFPVAAIAGRVGGRPAALAAGVLIAIMPGHFLQRSMLGYTDHHVLEALLSAVVVLVLMIGLKWSSSDERGPAGVRGSRRGIIIGLAAGVMLALYLLSWIGGSLFVGLLVAWALTQLVIEHMSRRSPTPVVLVTVLMLLTALLIVLPFGTRLPGFRLHRVALVIGVVIVCLVWGGTGAARRLPRAAFPFIAVVICGGAAGLFALVAPSTFESVVGQVDLFLPGHEHRTIAEATPLLSGPDGFSLRSAWGQFSMALPVSLVTLVVLAVAVVRGAERHVTLLVIWSGGLLVATLLQNRFASGYAVAAAVLCGVGLAWVVTGVVRRFMPPPAAAAAADDGTRRRRAGGRRPPQRVSTRPAAGGPALIGLTVVVVGLAVFAPVLAASLRSARGALVVPPDWRATLDWLRTSTPEPFGDAGAYVARYDTPEHAGGFRYPDSAYGVLAWWDYGYWITRLGRRLPNANPGQRGARAVARFFTQQDERSGREILDRLGTRFVIIDAGLPFAPGPDGRVQGKFPGIVEWTDTPLTEFFEACRWRDDQGVVRSTTVYYPAYFRTMLVRMFVFRGLAFDPPVVHVMTYDERVDDDGIAIKWIREARPCSSYAEARRVLDQHPAGTARIVATSPVMSCVPLEPVTSLRRVYGSPTIIGRVGDSTVSSVEVYEYDAEAVNPPSTPER